MIRLTCAALESMEENIKLPPLYHVSERNINGAVLVPRVPDNEFIKWGVEDGTTKRVSFGRSISKCLLALGRNLLNKELYVFVPDLDFTSKEKLASNLIIPTRKQVPDVHLTHEVWITTPVKLKYKMKIRVTSAGEEYDLVVHRKDKDEDYTGHPCEWNWEKIETPVEKVKDLFSKIKYGLRDPKTNKPWTETHKGTRWQDYDSAWRLAKPDETIKAGVGNCYDTVAISREYLKDEKQIQTATYWMGIKDGGFMDSPCHTFLIYWDTDDDWKWLEGSWGPFKKNTWHSKNKKELLKWIGTAMANMENATIEIHELSSYPPYGCNMEKFETMCRKAPVVLTVKPEKTK